MRNVAAASSARGGGDRAGLLRAWLAFLTEPRASAVLAALAARVSEDSRAERASLPRRVRGGGGSFARAKSGAQLFSRNSRARYLTSLTCWALPI